MKTNYFWVAENYNKRYNRLFAIGRDAHEVLVHSNGVEVVCVAVLTDSDLKRVAQEAFEAARASYKELDIGYEEITYITFDDYWAEQPARKGES